MIPGPCKPAPWCCFNGHGDNPPLHPCCLHDHAEQAKATFRLEAGGDAK